MGGEEQIMVGVFLGVEGDVTGSMMFLVEKTSAKHLINKVMMGMGSEGDDFTEMELSAMKEVGNIITGAYLNSLSTMTNLVIYPSPPDLTVDMAGAIFQGAELANSDFSMSENLNACRFDEETVWPDNEYLPEGFDSDYASDLSSLQDEEDYAESDY